MADTSYAYYDLESVSGPDFWTQPLHEIEAQLQARLARIEFMKRIDEIQERWGSTFNCLKSEYTIPSPPTTLLSTKSPVEMKEKEGNTVRQAEIISMVGDEFVEINGVLDLIVDGIVVVTEEKESGDYRSTGTEVADIVALNIFDEIPQTDIVPENVRFAGEDVIDIDAPKLFDQMLKGENGLDYQFVEGRLTNYVAHKPFDEIFSIYNHLAFQLAREIMKDPYFVLNLSKGDGYFPSELLLVTHYSYAVDDALLNGKSCILLFLVLESRDRNEPVFPMIAFDPGGSIITDRSHEAHPLLLGRAIFRFLRGTCCVEKHFPLQFESAYLSCATEGLNSTTVLNGCLAATLLEGCPPISLYVRELFWGNGWSCCDVDFPIPSSDIGKIYEQYCAAYLLQLGFVLNSTTTHVFVHEYWYLIVVMPASLGKMFRRIIEFTIITSESVFGPSNVRLLHHNAGDEIWVDDCTGITIPFTAVGKLRAKNGVVKFFCRGSSTCQTDEADVASALVFPFVPWKPPWTRSLLLKTHYEQYLLLCGEYINHFPSVKAYRDGLETLTNCKISCAQISSNALTHDGLLPWIIIDEAFIFDPGGLSLYCHELHLFAKGGFGTALLHFSMFYLILEDKDLFEGEVLLQGKASETGLVLGLVFSFISWFGVF